MTMATDPPPHVSGQGEASADSAIDDVGVVVIGRNEGERLITCLDALERCGVVAHRIVYVDSGSTDGSPKRVRDRGVAVIELSPPYTAAKGRNAGARFLLERTPQLLAIQFVDGDCEYFPAWFEVSTQVLRDDDSIAAVTGIQRERRPEASIFHQLIDVEWTGAIGELDAFGGNVMIRTTSWLLTSGYNEALIAGEDPELSIRLRQASGQRLVRIDEPMTLHDVDMTKVSQWWKRNVRAGHAYAEVSRLHGDGPERFWRRETRSNWLFGAALPVVLPALIPPAYGAMWWRIYRGARRRGMTASVARAYALFTVLGKVPQAVGQLTYWWNALRGAHTTIIEYKE
jgi:GT2 family glycosyltransferase